VEVVAVKIGAELTSYSFVFHGTPHSLPAETLQVMLLQTPALRFLFSLLNKTTQARFSCPRNFPSRESEFVSTFPVLTGIETGRK
jgi:hypothetical protein